MAKVYIVNLKDNRTNHDKNDDTKFNSCMSEGIIAIGWKDADETNRSFKTAINNLNRMEKDDLVWTKNPKTKSDFRLVRIIDDKVKKETDKALIDKDICFSRKVEKIKDFSVGSLPNGLKKNDIVARRTAERVHRQFLIDATLECEKNKGE